MFDIDLANSVDYERLPQVEGARETGERLEYKEWEAIFFFELIGYCPFVSRIEPEAVDADTWNDLWKQRFREAIPEYPLLARMWNEYEDAFYAPDEIDNLRNECLSVKSKTEDTIALKGLDKLIRCCNLAIKENIGLFMAGD